MKAVLIVVTILAGLLKFADRAPLAADPVPDAKEMVKKADEKMRGKSAFSILSIKTIRPGWSRDLKIKTWTMSNTHAMLLITSPAKENGTAFLKIGKEVWNWVPSIERVIKLPPSMMSQSWMGTDFTNDDLVKESSVIDDYVHTYLKDSAINGRMCCLISMTPKPETAVVWGKILTWIDKTDYMQLKVEFYDEENTLISSMISSDFKKMGGRLLPSRIEMNPADKPANKTVMIYDSLAFNIPIDQSFFSTQNMKKVK